jgi:hypothetical protein
VAGTPVNRKVTVANLNAALDHGALSGKSDDDHTQYALVAGSSTDNAIMRWDGVGGRTPQNSDVTVSDVSGSSVSVATTAGNALAIAATAPAATVGASQAGKAASLTASAAVASTDTAGAAAGGSVTITAGAAARLTSGNANGGDIILATGAGIGTGTAGRVLVPAGTSAANAILFNSQAGLYSSANNSLTVDLGTNEWTFTNSAFGTPVGSQIQASRAIGNQTGNFSTNNNNARRALYTNSGAGGSITATLAAAEAGLEYIFYVQSANNIVVTAAAGDTIRIAGGVSSSGGTATNGTVGGVLQLVAINATEWVAIATQGTWTLA